MSTKALSTVAKLLAVILFLWLLIVSVLWKMPINWLIQQAQQGIIQPNLSSQQSVNINSLHWQQLEGTVGFGKATKLDTHLNTFESLEWEIPFWRLVILWPVAKLKIGEKNPWVIHSSLHRNGHLRVNAQAGDLAHLRGSPKFPWSLAGKLEGQVILSAQLHQDAVICKELSTELIGELRLLRPVPLDLGRVQLSSSCLSEQALQWNIQAKQRQQHQLNAEGELSTNQWKFTANAEVKDGNSLQKVLYMLNWPQKPQNQSSQLAPSKLYSSNKSGAF